MRKDRKDCDYIPYKEEMTRDTMQIYNMAQRKGSFSVLCFTLRENN